MFYSTTVVSFILLLAPTILMGQASEVPRFEPDRCAIPVPAVEKHVDCGYLVVKENRTSGNTRTIRLSIAILRSDAVDKKPDPVLKTLGGPGASSLRMLSARRAFPWLRDRDFIIFEQRGTRHAQPALECPEVDEARADAGRQHLSHSAAKALEVSGAQRCYQRLSSAGIDLSAYNSRESAADIEDLRRVLGIEKLNIYGVSYSARLMLDVLMHHPQGIRSVVLESALATEVNYDQVGVDGVVRALNVLFDSCRHDRACDTAFPRLKAEFYAVVARLNREPMTVSTPAPKTHELVDLELNGNDFATWIIDYLFSDQPSSTVKAPMVIHKAFNGDYVQQFKRYAGDKLSSGFYSWGMRYSVWCSEEFPFESISKIRAQSHKCEGLRGYEVMSLPDICRVWKVKAAAPSENKPFTSPVPTFILGAEYDAYTDPAWGRSVARRFKHSFFFEIPWAGHGPAFSVPCVSEMIAGFVDDPHKQPGNSCVTETRRHFHFVVE